MSTGGRPLSAIAKTIRSKNAGVDHITFDVIFPDRASYDHVRHSGALSPAAICRVFGIDPQRLTDHVEFDPAFAIKFTIARDRASGSLGDGDLFGSQHYAPLIDIVVPECAPG